MNRHLPDLQIADEKLREWAHFFRDRRKFERCRSIEHRFRADSEDFGPNGWGDNEAAPVKRPDASWSLPAALLTHELLDELPKLQKWIVTYHYCYPYLPRAMVLRAIRKWAGRRLNWKAFEEQLDIARCRIYTAICCGGVLTRNEKAA
jgi:hypothetical protein